MTENCSAIESRDTDLKSEKKLEQNYYFFWEKNDFENFDFREKKTFSEKKNLVRILKN